MMNTIALSPDRLRSVCPSLYADSAHATRSARYTYIPTIRLVDALSAEGFLPVSATQSRSRDESRRDFTKHLVRFRRSQDIDRITSQLVNGRHVIDHKNPLHEFPEIVLLNSHDGSSAYQLMSGIFRLVCCNGLIVGNTTTDYKVRHSGQIVDNVLSATFALAQSFDATLATVAAMKQITLAPSEARILAESAATVRFDLQPGDASPVAVEKFLQPRRLDDQSNDLWTTFNRIQENTLRGGLRGQTTNDRGQRRNLHTREVKGIDQSVALNRALWSLAEKMAELKK